MSATDKNYIDDETSFAAADANGLTRELNRAILSTGQTLDEGDNEQTGVAMGTYSHLAQGYSDSGSANNYILSNSLTSLQPVKAYVNSMKVRFKAGSTNTGGSTVNVEGIGSSPILTSAGVALIGGEIQANAWIEMVYDTTSNSFLITSTSGASAAKVPSGYISGFGMANDAGDTEHDILFNVGVASDAEGRGTLDNKAGATIVKQIDNTWTEGSGLGGRPAAVALAPDTWYRCFAIAKTGGQVDFGFDQADAADAANLIAAAQVADPTWTYYRQVGWVLTDPSENIFQFIQDGDYFTWSNADSPYHYPFTGSVGSRAAVTVNVPPHCRLVGNAQIQPNSVGSHYLNITSEDQFDSVPASGNSTAASFASGTDAVNIPASINIKVNSSSQIYQRASSAQPCSVWFDTYFYDRGKG